jgi:DnaJ domain
MGSRHRVGRRITVWDYLGFLALRWRLFVALFALVSLVLLLKDVPWLGILLVLGLGGWIYYRHRQKAEVEGEAERAADERANQEKQRFTREEPPAEETSPAWPFEILGVPPSATEKQIRDAYRALVFRYHPDHNAGDENARQRFMAVQAAYEELGFKT